VGKREHEAGLVDFARHLAESFECSNVVHPHDAIMRTAWQNVIAASSSSPMDCVNDEIATRFSSFWSLDLPTNITPLLANCPGLAWKASRDRRDFCNESIYMQRAIVPSCQRELQCALWPSFENLTIRVSTTHSHDLITGLSSANLESLKDLSRAAEGISVLDSIRIAKVWGAIGCYQRQLHVLAGIRNPCSDDELTLLQCARLSVLKQLTRPGSNSEYEKQLEDLFSSVIQTTSLYTLRNRFLTSISAVVYYGRREDYGNVQRWSTTAGQLVTFILDHFGRDSFESQLLTSRYHRAISYSAYLIDDKETLQKELTLFMDLATGLRPKSRIQKILARENLFASLETASRIYSKLNRHDDAQRTMLELVSCADALDAKGWLQLGDLLSVHGDDLGALNAFMTAASIGFPHATIAWYRAARCFEKLGELRRAMSAHFLSMIAWPAGVSPLARLYVLARKTGEQAIEQFSIDRLIAKVSHNETISAASPI
jgi:tetratricopeptide (TPR) repeat protein